MFIASFLGASDRSIPAGPPPPARTPIAYGKRWGVESHPVERPQSSTDSPLPHNRGCHLLTARVCLPKHMDVKTFPKTPRKQGNFLALSARICTPPNLGQLRCLWLLSLRRKLPAALGQLQGIERRQSAIAAICPGMRRESDGETMRH